MTSPHITVQELQRALGGDITRGNNGPQVLSPGPGHSEEDRSLAISPADNADGFIVHSHAGDDPIACKDYVRQKLGLPAFQPRNGKDHSPRTTADGRRVRLSQRVGRIAVSGLPIRAEGFSATAARRKRRVGLEAEWRHPNTVSATGTH